MAHFIFLFTQLYGRYRFFTGPILLQGYDANNSLSLQEVGVGHINPWTTTSNWFDYHHSELISSIFPSFWKMYNQETWHKTLKKAIYWYVRGNNQEGGLDGAIILLQAALELLAWVYLVGESKAISKSGFGKVPACDQIRLLLSMLNIPLEIPQELGELKKPSKSFSWEDGADAISQIRNSIVHPKKIKAKIPYREAWHLCLWYLELVFLRLFGHNGVYSNRLKTSWVGEVELVPWSVK